METDLDALSNSVLDSIEAGDYDEAEKRCRRLLLEYPEMLDGHDRLATLREAQGRFKEAAEHYEKAMLVVHRHPEGTDQETVQELKEKRDRALAKAKA
ncbi:MAG: tetratricopeptide repeat protein [Candidatus Tectomicrobia bacterium]|nr:tetratricopeptide repeat protein [Candidatus Tectomicrobia bacterium]